MAQGSLQHGQGGDHRRLHAVVGGGGFPEISSVLPTAAPPPSPRPGLRSRRRRRKMLTCFTVSSWGQRRFLGRSVCRFGGLLRRLPRSGSVLSWGTRPEMTFVPSDTRYDAHALGRAAVNVHIRRPCADDGAVVGDDEDVVVLPTTRPGGLLPVFFGGSGSPETEAAPALRLPRRSGWPRWGALTCSCSR